MLDTVKLRSRWKKNDLVFRALGYSLSDSLFTKPAQTKKMGRKCRNRKMRGDGGPLCGLPGSLDEGPMGKPVANTRISSTPVKTE